MESYKVNTPEGTRDKLFGESDRQRSAEAAMIRLFRRRGYREVITPGVEYYDLFVQAQNPLPQESMLKLIDRSGRILVMRPDCTTPIARVAATRLAETGLPQRLFYNQTIFRSRDANHGVSSEIAQCGIELIGAAGMRPDVEAVALAVEAVRAAGLEEFRIELGHTGFFTALAEEMGVTGEKARALRDCIENKSFAVLDDMLGGEASSAAAAMKRIAVLFGGAEILDEARALTDNPQALAVIDYLSGIYAELDAAGMGEYISFDLGLVSGLEYYTGLIFRGYAPGAGSTIVSGGRYDNLINDFGKAIPATGFAVYVDSLVSCLPREEPKRADTIIYYKPGCLRQALELIDSLPEGSAELSGSESESGCMDAAFARGFKRMMIVSKTGNVEVKIGG
ncbi:MAG: ATP phosphoribosyltransferase regulatory subunit [Clostridiales bacterium]|nr:ATP phosphoribosyltransferase regulatory subunit [Clostridiales bacterium]